MDKSKLLVVLGGSGKIGTYLQKLLLVDGYNFKAPTHHECDLLDGYAPEQYFSKYQPTYVINLYGRTTNISLCDAVPASICRDTLLANMTVLNMCNKYKVEKLLNVICSCSYDGSAELLIEDDFWRGNPHKSILAHGLSKKMIYGLSQMYNKQYKLNVVTVALNNVFGGNKAKWANTANLKFLDAIIKRVVDAKYGREKEVELWGTGAAKREVIYYKNAAAALLDVFSQYNSNELINVGTGKDLNIREWAEFVTYLVEYSGKIVFRGGNDGQMQKLFSVEKSNREILWTGGRYPEVVDTLREAIEEYKQYLKVKNEATL